MRHQSDRMERGDMATKKDSTNDTRVDETELSLLQQARFWSRVQIGADDECWPWLGSRDSWGYGAFCWSRKPLRQTTAHRIAFILRRGRPAFGLELDHLCRNRKCCNPSHLEPVTHAENIRRGGPATKTHCVNGHEFTPENTRQRARGGRECRTCINASLRDAWKRGARKRGANG